MTALNMQTCPHRPLVLRPLRVASQAQRLASQSAAHACPSRHGLRAPAPQAAGVEQQSTSAEQEALDQRLGNGNNGQASDVATAIDAVALESEAGQDYSSLQSSLRNGEFQKADDITRQKLIELAGPGAVKRGWVYFTEVKFIPSADMLTIDNLWRASSRDLFGFSVQREIWRQQSQYWTRFFKQINWVMGEANYYRKWPQDFEYTLDARKGHLPLTNALRGTQLLKAVLEHPAFEKRPSSGSGSSSSSNGTPDWLK